MPAAADAHAPTAPAASGRAVARVCAIIVTWNRKDYVTTVLKALSKQTYPMRNVDVVVVDNAGTDGTLDHLIATFNPERVVDNDTEKAHEPKFGSPRVREGANGVGGNTLGLASLSIVRNRANMGGCGGFNTGFAFVEHWFGKAGLGGPDFVWLVDDDIDLPTDTLENLTKTMSSDQSIGLVGSRTCDLNDRDKTIETTIYFNDRNGCMQDDAPEHHRNHAKHIEWSKASGGTKGRHGYTGTMDVDVVSACSMLARWSAVLGDDKRKGVGFWDARYFIYCDDADWCLRFARAGWRVVLSLDAVVYHTPWNLKLTPARIYYANRNRLWMAQKVLPTERLREVTTTTLRGIMQDALHAAMHRRVFHSRLIMQTATDVVDNVGGKTGSDGPAAMPVIEALREAGALTSEATVAVLCNQRDSMAWFAALVEHVRAETKGNGPRLVPVVRNDVRGAPADGADGAGGAVVYGKRLRSRLKKQLRMLRLRPRACVVWDSNNDFPIWTGTPFTLHIDTRKPTMAQLERDGWGTRLAFIAKWIPAWFRLNRYAATVEPYAGTGRYG